MGVQVVWFKRDLRGLDHEPLLRAASVGPCVCLYVYEPEIFNSAEFDTSHLIFINQSLAELDQELQQRGAWLTYRVGRMPDVLDELKQTVGIEALWSHEETGNRITYDRDRRVVKWAKRHGVPWNEIPQNGVIRRLESRDGWSQRRERFMSQPLSPSPELIHPVTELDAGRLQTPANLGLPTSRKTDLQAGGAQAAGKRWTHSLISEAKNTPAKCPAPSQPLNPVVA